VAQQTVRRWQFDLKTMLAVIAALSVPFWMLTNAAYHVRFWGVVVLVLVVGGSGGFLAARWAGVWPGIGITVLLAAAMGLILAALGVPL
jgi:hypothetical protein